jgi:hypothetical protein
VLVEAVDIRILFCGIDAGVNIASVPSCIHELSASAYDVRFPDGALVIGEGDERPRWLRKAKSVFATIWHALARSCCWVNSPDRQSAIIAPRHWFSSLLAHRSGGV